MSVEVSVHEEHERGTQGSPLVMSLFKAMDLVLADQVIPVPAELEGGIRGLLAQSRKVAKNATEHPFGRVYTEEERAIRRAKHQAIQLKRAAVESSEKRRLQKMRGKKRGKR